MAGNVQQHFEPSKLSRAMVERVKESTIKLNKAQHHDSEIGVASCKPGTGMKKANDAVD